MSRRYSNFFPNLSVSWNKGNWNWQLNVNEKISRPSYRQLGNFMQFDKSFANRTWIIYLSANDIFKTAKERWTMYGLGAGTTKDCYNYTRNISLQVTYNFNAKRSKYKGTGAGNEEKNRL